MGQLTDPIILAKFRRALGQWRFTGYVTWKPIARQWVEQNLEGWTTRAIAEELAVSLIVAAKLIRRPRRGLSGASGSSITTFAWSLASGCFILKRS
jgi:hypothetical protein